MVKPAPTLDAPDPPARPAHARSVAVARTGSSAIRDLLEITQRPDVLSLAGGLPLADAFPTAALAEAFADAMADDPGAALQYGATEGYRPLRSWVAQREGADLDEVVVTHGSQQALDLLARALVDPGDVVALADPADIGALQAFRAAGADLAAIPTDEHGLRVDVLAERLAAGLRPVAVYVVATFDNPSGTTLPADRRVALAALADRYGFVLIEDDPYGELRWAGEAGTPLRALTDRAVRLGTTSKVLCPGLRVGWAVGPADLVRSLVVLKQGADLHTGSLDQQLAHRVLDRPGFLPHHLADLRRRYSAQCQVLADALRDAFGDRISFVEPQGGMFLWATLAGGPADLDTAALLATAVDHGVAYVPGAAFSVADPHHRSLRLSFATNDADLLVESVARLSRTFRTV